MKHWFSALVRMVCLIEGTGAVDYMDCLHIFQSQNFDTAFKEALKLVKSMKRNIKTDKMK